MASVNLSVTVGRRALIAGIVLAVALLSAAVALAYSGPGGCPSNLRAGYAEECQWHANVRRVIIRAYGSHTATFPDGGNGVCYAPNNVECTADTGYHYSTSGRAATQNLSTHTQAPTSWEHP